jgi:beta-glucosidase
MRFSRPSLALSLLLLGSGVSSGQSQAPPAYLDPELDFEARARDLVSRLTLDEKISQLMNDAPAIPRLEIPAYEWWNECLHGVARAGIATVFPQAIGLAATFDAELIHEMAEVISDEARAKHNQFVREGSRRRYQGLTFWSPNINIFRDPRWGRGQETYGEDPYLTARMGIAFVRGLQGDDPRYYKVIATAKHYAVHSGPEPERHEFDVQPSERDLHETYLPAFRALVQEGKVASVMGAYNRVNGESASADRRLLIELLREQWGFDGYVVSDCGAIQDIFQGHGLVETPEEAAARGVTRGCDLECGNVYHNLGAAVERGLLTESDIDVALTRLMRARLRLGLFDPPERVPFAETPYGVNDAPAHTRLSRRVARESMVLLKNDGLLPLPKDLGTVAVVGPNADALITLVGNYYGVPSHPVTVLDGIRGAVSPSTRVLYARGVDLVEGRTDPHSIPPIESEHLRPEAGSNTRGLKGEYFEGRDLQGTPVLTRVDPQVDFRWFRGGPTDELVSRGELPRESALGGDDYSVRWTGRLLPPVTGSYELTLTANDTARLLVDGQVVLGEWAEHATVRTFRGSLELEAGREYDVQLEYFEGGRDAEVSLGWTLPGAGDPFEAALSAARAADVVIFVGGLTAEVEGEEMPATFPGFRGGDRTDIELPGIQRRMLQALQDTGKPVVFVVMAGSALALGWEQQNLPGILLAWYPGQEGGNAVADVLFGDVSPAGRLPVTFYASAADLPPFSDYSMQGRTYRYFEGDVLYPFGHGLSYTRFEYANLLLSRAVLDPGDRLEVSVDVTNVGERSGDEVVQLYVRDPESQRPMPLQQLRGFERVSLRPGESRKVRFALVPEQDLSYYDEERAAFAVEPGAFEIRVGPSSREIRLEGEVQVE